MDLAWQWVGPGVLASLGIPRAYLLVDGDRGLLIGPARGARLSQLPRAGINRIELALLTHHHRDTSAQAGTLVRERIRVLAPHASQPWITPAGVDHHWRVSMPRASLRAEVPLHERTWGLWNYLVHAQGIDGVDCQLRDGDTIPWRSWLLQVISAPGHSRDQVAFLASSNQRVDGRQRNVLFCADALAAAGKLWAPYTTDWDHWTDEGLRTSADALRRLADLQPDLLCMEHGDPILDQASNVLRCTADAVDQAGRRKSFSRFLEEQPRPASRPEFLAPEQVASAGERPWTQLSPNLWLTGNTYAIASRHGALALVDPYGPAIAEQVRRLRAQCNLGPLEVVFITHAHNDHYQGLFLLDQREPWKVWTLEQVAQAVENPYRFLAPYLDARPVGVDRRLTDGMTVTWREYSFQISHLPGQTDFTMGLEATVDGRRYFWTADNFFHAEQFGGSGGWSGRNRALPWQYLLSAERVRKSAPDWILAEHGGPFAFDPDDFQARIDWARAACEAADALSISGDLRIDWDPHRIRVEPLRQQVSPGQSVAAEIVATNPADVACNRVVELEPQSIATADPVELRIAPRGTARRQLLLRVDPNTQPGLHVVPLVVWSPMADATRREDPADVFLVLDVVAG